MPTVVQLVFSTTLAKELALNAMDGAELVSSVERAVVVANIFINAEDVMAQGFGNHVLGHVEVAMAQVAS